jgi:hypothetical protein
MASQVTEHINDFNTACHDIRATHPILIAYGHTHVDGRFAIYQAEEGELITIIQDYAGVVGAYTGIVG